MKLSRSAVVSLALLILAAAWFGSRLGPRAKERPATQESAILAAQGFVESSIKARGGRGAPLPVDVTFPAGSTSAEPDAGTNYSIGDPNLWTVTGTAMAGAVPMQWTVRERWDGVHQWRLKAIEVWAQKTEE